MYRAPQNFSSKMLIRQVLVATGLIIGGCSSGPTELNPDPELKEIPSNKKNDIDSPEGALFDSAKKSYQNRLYSVAKDQFTALQNNFPTGPYAEYSELKIADCNFFVHDYDVSASLYEQYAKSHPGSLSAAYALLMSARSFHLSSKGVGHDAHALERAREMYTRLIEQYPDSVYSKQAVVYQQATIADLTENEMRVAEFYRKQGKEEAYLARLKIIREKWRPLATKTEMPAEPDSKAVALTESTSPQSTTPELDSASRMAEDELAADQDEAKSLVMASADLKSAEQPDQIAEASEVVLEEEATSEVPAPPSNDVDGEREAEPEEEGVSSPEESVEIEEELVEDEEEASEDTDEQEQEDDQEEDEEESEDTDEIPSDEAQSEEPIKAEQQQVFSQSITRPVPQPEGPQPVRLIAPPARLDIVRVECKDSAIYLHLSQPWQDRGFLIRNEVLSPVDGIVSVTLPLTRSEEKTYSCFGISDLLITSNGTVTLETVKPMFVRSMANPSRLALIIKNIP